MDNEYSFNEVLAEWLRRMKADLDRSNELLLRIADKIGVREQEPPVDVERDC